MRLLLHAPPARGLRRLWAVVGRAGGPLCRRVPEAVPAPCPAPAHVDSRGERRLDADAVRAAVLQPGAPLRLPLQPARWRRLPAPRAVSAPGPASDCPLPPTGGSGWALTRGSTPLCGGPLRLCSVNEPMTQPSGVTPAAAPDGSPALVRPRDRLAIRRLLDLEERRRHQGRRHQGWGQRRGRRRHGGDREGWARGQGRGTGIPAAAGRSTAPGAAPASRPSWEAGEAGLRPRRLLGADHASRGGPRDAATRPGAARRRGRCSGAGSRRTDRNAAARPASRGRTAADRRISPTPDR